MSLPTQIPLQSVPIAEKGNDGNLYMNFNWYLFLYNMGKQTFESQGSGGGGSPISNGDLIDMVELDSFSADVPQLSRQIANLMLLALDPTPADPPPQSGAPITVTPGASPFTYTAIHDGTMFVSGTVGPILTFTRRGVNVPLGMSDGTIPMREKDQLTLTWSGGTPPVLTFLPNR